MDILGGGILLWMGPELVATFVEGCLCCLPTEDSGRQREGFVGRESSDILSLAVGTWVLKPTQRYLKQVSQGQGAEGERACFPDSPMLRIHGGASIENTDFIGHRSLSGGE